MSSIPLGEVNVADVITSVGLVGISYATVFRDATAGGAGATTTDAGGAAAAAAAAAVITSSLQ
jgi:hypothetical protein